MVECVVFHCPQNMHILSGCPRDLVRFESVQPNAHFAMIEITKLEKKYAPKNPSGYPASVYHYCSLSQWEEWLAEESQLTLFT